QAHRLAEPHARLGRLRAHRPRHAGGAASCRPVRPGAQPQVAGRARALSGSPVEAGRDHMPEPVLVEDELAALKASGEPFAVATVVRTVALTAAKAGAKAVIRRDGTISAGWIGGGCARAAVLTAALAALADGRPRLVSVQPPEALSERGVDAGHTR